MLSAADLRGMYAIMPTPAKDDADRLDAVDTVDLDETARVADRLIRDGSSGLIALGMTGECATLAQADYEAFVDCLLATVNRVPTFVGTTALGAHEVVRRVRFVRERGADGTLLGPRTTSRSRRSASTPPATEGGPHPAPLQRHAGRLRGARARVQPALGGNLPKVRRHPGRASDRPVSWVGWIRT